jgi:hypothetical protein
MQREEKYGLYEAQAAIIVVAILQAMLNNQLAIGPKMFLVFLEIILVVAIGISASLKQKFSDKIRQYLAVLLIIIITLVNVSSLILVVHALLGGISIPGKTLIFTAVSIFLTNVIMFAIWYWELDSPGLTGLRQASTEATHFLFPQMNIDKPEFKKWCPHFVDYLYLSTTNATAFSPTDTMPLTHVAKVLMGMQSIISLLTLALVISRAVNILA